MIPVNEIEFWHVTILARGSQTFSPPIQDRGAGLAFVYLASTGMDGIFARLPEARRHMV